MLNKTSIVVIPNDEQEKVIEEFTKYVGQLKRKYVVDTKDLDKTFHNVEVLAQWPIIEEGTNTHPKDYDEFIQALDMSGGTLKERIKLLDLLDSQVIMKNIRHFHNLTSIYFDN